MMDTIEVLQALREIGVYKLIDSGSLKPSMGKDYSRALDEAVEALDNKQFSKHKIDVLEQENEFLTKRSQWALEQIVKYENVLIEMTQYFRCKRIKGLYLSEEECHKYKSCAECLSKYFKKQVGLEADV